MKSRHCQRFPKGRNHLGRLSLRASRVALHRTFGANMATIQLEPDHADNKTWWMKWLERNEIIGRIVLGEDGRWRIAPEGSHWSPMKSFAGFSSDNREAALAEVQLYFEVASGSL